MRFVPTPIASQLTGLSTEKLREWTCRRALITADRPSKTKGSPARFSWQTILVLRIAVLLRDQFSLELQSHQAGFAELRTLLRSQSFVALWGRRLKLGSDRTWMLLERDGAASDRDELLIALDPHLAALRDGFALPSASDDGQLDLFSLSTVNDRRRAKVSSRRMADRRAS